MRIRALKKLKPTSSGAAMSLVITLLSVLILIGAGLFYLMQIISGDRQISNATDAGALAGARQILCVTLTTNQVANLPQEFQGLGVDINGNVCPSGKDSNGQPALFNIIAYNNCAAYTLEIAFNAADEDSPTAIANASNVIVALNRFATQLNQNIQSSSYIPNAASQFMAANSTNILPKLYGNSPNATKLLPGSVAFGYYATNSSTSNVYFPTAFSDKDSNITKWVNQTLSQTASANNGPNLIAAAQPFDINKITNRQGFVGSDGKDLVIALVPFQPDLTHLISTSNFSTTPPGSTASLTYVLPPNALKLTGQVNSAQTIKDSAAPSLNVLSAAVVNNLSQFAAYIPATSITTPPTTPPTIGSTTTTPPGTTGNNPPFHPSPAYVAIVNGGDFVTSLNNNGCSAAELQAAGYTNINLTPTTNIAYNGSKTDIFDVLNWESFTQLSAQFPGMLSITDDWIMVGTNSPTGMFDTYSQGGVAALQNVVLGPQIFPANNFNGVVDNPNMSSTAPSVPFVLLADYLDPAFTGNYMNSANMELTVQASLTSCLNDFGEWINYNRSVGSDGLHHNPNLDPLKAYGGSPSMFKKNPNAVVPNTLVSATSDFEQFMTISDALKIVDFCVLHDGQFVFNGQPAWMDNLMPVIASNYGFNYLPIPLNETKPNGFTAIEYTKAQVICLHAGLGLYENPPVLPSNLQMLFMPGTVRYSWQQNQPPYTNAAKVSSGLRYFEPYYTDGTRAHYVWPEPPGTPKFETPGTPLQLLRYMNLLNNNGTFNPNGPEYTSVLNSILKVLDQMNPKINMTDLTNVLNSATIDLGQTFFLMYNPGQTIDDGLIMVTSLPNGEKYQPADSIAPIATFTSTYQISCGRGEQQATQMSGITHTIVCASADPNETISYNGQLVCTAPYGDSEMHRAPYNTFMVDVPPSSLPLWVYATDSVTFWPSSGSSNNHGELHLNETVGNDFEPRCIN